MTGKRTSFLHNHEGKSGARRLLPFHSHCCSIAASAISINSPCSVPDPCSPTTHTSDPFTSTPTNTTITAAVTRTMLYNHCRHPCLTPFITTVNSTQYRSHRHVGAALPPPASDVAGRSPASHVLVWSARLVPFPVPPLPHKPSYLYYSNRCWCRPCHRRQLQHHLLLLLQPLRLPPSPPPFSPSSPRLSLSLPRHVRTHYPHPRVSPLSSTPRVWSPPCRFALM